MTALTILPVENKTPDFLALGGLVIRLDPGQITFAFADKCDLHVSGGEYTDAKTLSQCFVSDP